MEFKFIQSAFLPHRLDITINNPPVNILTGAMMKEMVAVLKDAADDPHLRVVVLKGEGKAWSAGADVSEHLPDKFSAMLEVFGELCELVRTFPVPTIAAVDGLCLGGGCEVAAMCDFIVASERAKFGQPEIKVGVIPPVACAYFARKYGLGRAAEIILTGDVYSAADAFRLGLVTRLVPVESFAAEVDAFAGKFTALSGAVLRLAKQALQVGLKRKREDSLEMVDSIYREQLMGTKDAVEGLTAFLEKRRPDWADK